MQLTYWQKYYREHREVRREAGRVAAIKHRPRIIARMKKNFDLRRKQIDLAKQKPCYDCNKEYPPYILEFDHRDPAQKLFTVGSGASSRWATRLTEEIAKCDVVCANCHKIRTFKRKVSRVPIDV